MKGKLRAFFIGLAGLGILSGIIGLTLLNPHFYITKMAIIMKSGKVELTEGNYSDAADYFLLAINLNSRKTEAYLLLADAFIGMNSGEHKYVVSEGDTLQSIAAQYYDDETMAGAIYDRNRENIIDWTKLTPGMALYLPLAEGETPPDMTEDALYYLKKGLAIKENAKLRKKYEELLKTIPEPEPSESPEPSPLPELEEGERYYTVRSNDTLQSISTRVYGTPDMAEAIYQRNRDSIPDKIALEQGVVLVMPVDTQDDTLVTPSPSSSESPSESPSTAPSESPSSSPEVSPSESPSPSPEVSPS